MTSPGKKQYNTLQNIELFFFKTTVYSLSSLFSLSVHVHDTCIPSPSYLLISLFPVIICFEHTISRTLLDFPWRFELSGVNCSKVKFEDFLVMIGVKLLFMGYIEIIFLRLSPFKILRKTGLNLYLSTSTELNEIADNHMSFFNCVFVYLNRWVSLNTLLSLWDNNVFTRVSHR